jgi:preprotein translocase subunit SecD
MMIGRWRFNRNLLLAVALAAAVSGCSTSKKKDKDGPFALISVHLESGPDTTLQETEDASVLRSSPIPFKVLKEPIVTEVDVERARTVDEIGGYAIELTLRQHGAWVLEEYTTENPSRHLVIYSEFGEKMKEHRWLAAPKINRRNSTGVLTFTPDASQEEINQIVLGLNNTAKKLDKKDQ